MARKLFGVVAAVALASGALFALVGTASAVPAVNTLNVDKVVSGTVPSGTVFTVSVSCTSAGDTTLYFDETGHASDKDGNQITAPVINPHATDTCTVTETEDGGATSVGYGCELGTTHVRTTCQDDNVVHYTDVVGDSATVTVTNTFETPTTTTAPATTTTTVAPKTAPQAVIAPAHFTG